MSALQELTASGQVRALHRQQSVEKEASNHGEPELQRPSKTLSGVSLVVIALAVVATFTGLFFSGWIPRQHRNAALASEAERIRTALPRVRITKPRQAPAIAVALLPGDVQAMEHTTIYPRTSGYVKRWLVDIGDEVESGQLMAEISTPEVLAQLQQSEAALSESKATLERSRATVNLTTITTKRLRGLVSKNAVTQQELDDAEANQAVAVANMRLAEATVEVNTASAQHMRELLSFSEIHAPFSGTVTARNIDAGQLVTSGNGTGQALFQLARTNPARIFVNVPQIFAPGVTKDLSADIIVREIPGRKFQGKVTRTARAIDPLTRTLLTEIQVPNDDHALLTGAYVQVRMEVARQVPPLLIPATALVFNASGTQVAVVGPAGQIQLRAVEVVGDSASEIAISTGITLEDQVVTNPGDRMSDGLNVEIEAAPETPATAPAPAPAKKH